MTRALALLTCVTCSVLCMGQAITYTPETYPAQGQPAAQGDLNGDGITDIVTIGSYSRDGGNTYSNGFWVMLSNTDGSYQTPVFYAAPYNGPVSSIALGDFNNDGTVDLAEVEQNTDYYVYLNKGDGTFGGAHGVRISDTTVAFQVATVDLNRDGKVDLAVLDDANGTIYLRIFTGDGSGNFTPSSSVPAVSGKQIFVGDFDGDGKADVATTFGECNRGVGCDTYVQTYWGDGSGGFSQVTQTYYTTEYDFTTAIDVNQDGKTDLVGVAGYGGSAVRILLGSDSRTYTARDVATQYGSNDVAVGDINGDGIFDLAVLESNNGSYQLGVRIGNPDGTYQTEQFIYSDSTQADDSVMVGRYDRDREADLVVRNSDLSPYAGGTFDFLHNTTGGPIPSCAPPNAARGITICSPTTASDGSTHIEVGAAFTSPLRKTEIWIDGVKKYQSFYTYATYAFLDHDVTLSSGSHTIDAYAVTYDGRLEKASTTFTAGSGGGGGGSCSAPSSPGAVHICSPTSGSTVGSPVTFQAQGGSAVNYLEAWLDGVKLGYWRGSAGTVSFTFSKSLAAGAHRFTVIAKVEPNTTDTDREVVNFTVSSGGTTGSCPEPSTANGINVCSPANGSTVSSPVTFQAHGGSAVNYLEAWLDGQKLGYWRGTAGTVEFNFNYVLGPGSHRFTVISKIEPNTADADRVVVYFTVK